MSNFDFPLTVWMCIGLAGFVVLVVYTKDLFNGDNE